MLVRTLPLIISVLYIQVRGFQQNGINNISNLILNKTSPLNTQSNSFQSKLNQSPINLQSNLLQSDNLKLAKNLHQALSLQQATNLQNGNTQQNAGPSAFLQSKLQTPLPGQQAGNLQQSNILQPNINMQPTANSVYSNNLPQNINVLPQNQNSGNLQILRQAPDISVIPNTQISPAYLEANPNSNAAIPSLITSIPTSQINPYNLNLPNEAASIVRAQNQPFSHSNAPSYVIDVSQVTNNVPVPATVLTTTSTYENQPSVISIVTPQQYQQPYIVQSSILQTPIENPNQITIVKSPQSTKSPINPDQNLISFINPVLNQTVSYKDPLESILVSTLSKKASKSSSLKEFLPLILNILKEQNNCGCPNHCDCSRNTKKRYEDSTPPSSFCPDYNSGYAKQNKHSYKPERKQKYSNDYSEEDGYDSYENRRNNRRSSKRAKVKPESTEYDYSEELQED